MSSLGTDSPRSFILSERKGRPCPFEFCTVIDNLKEIVFRTDTDGKLTFLNPAWSQITGFAVVEALGNHLLHYIHPEDRQSHSVCFQEFLAAGSGHWQSEFRHLKRGGGFCWMEVYASPIFDPRGGFAGTCGTIADRSAHKAALETLQSTQARLQYLLDSSPAVIFTADPGCEYRATWISENVAAMFGIPAPRFLGQPYLWSELTAPQDREGVQAFCRSLPPGRSGNVRHRMRLPSGEMRWVRVDIRLTAGRPGEAPQAVGCMIDVTEAMDALERLRSRDATRQAIGFAAERFLRGEAWETVLPAAIERLAKATGVTRIAVIQRVSGPRGGPVAHTQYDWLADGQGRAQPAAPSSRTGSRPFPIPESWKERFEHGEAIVGTRSAFSEREREVLQGEDIGSIAMIPIFVGTAHWGMICFILKRECEWSLETLEVLRIAAGIIGAGMQQSEARHQLQQAHLKLEDRVQQRTLQLAEANRALRESSELFHVVFDEAPIGIAVLGRESRFRVTNRSFRRMLGYSAEELSGMTEPEILHPADVASCADNHSQEMLQSEKRYLSKPGVEVWTRSTVASLPPIGKESLVVAMIEDITGRKELEDQFRHAQKMEAIGRLAGGIAHDFNNLLTVIRGFSELLLRRLTSDPGSRRKTEEILKATDRAAALVEQLVAFSRKQIVRPKIVEINAAIREMESMLLRLIGEDVQFSTHLDPLAGPVRIDDGQLGQLVMNLVVNARDAMPSGGALKIVTGILTLDTEAAPPCAGMGAGRYTVLEVGDTGIGMTEETMSRIFEPFYTTKDVGKGTGLGLSTVYGIVGQAGGHISVDSAPGAGSVFHIYFPVACQEYTSSSAPVSQPSLREGNGTILLTEDDEPLRRLMAEALTDCGYTVLEARHGRDALDVAKMHSGNIDLLLTDVVMPEMSGPELWANLAPSFPRMSLLYISGYIERQLQAGSPLMKKPFSIDALTAAARQILEAPHPDGPFEGHPEEQLPIPPQ
jgi:PAS domain S-box-containing protein